MPDSITLDEKDKRCAPNITFKEGSCISLNLLIKMAEAYNKKFKDDQIKLNKNSAIEILNPCKYKKHLLEEFSKRLSNVCDSQRCWVKQDFMKELAKDIKKELQENIFRPSGPKGKFEWLNTLHINDVMKQYEEKYKDFKFLGAVPMDFGDLDCLGIKDLDFDDLKKKGIRRLGMVVNTHQASMPGEHWLGLAVSFSDNQVYYFDSYGIAPEARVRAFMRKCAKHCDDIKKLDVQYNKHRHQYKNSECGVYSITFIIRLLEGKSFDEITKNKVNDDIMNENRQVYFT